jgi:hypothetical protein
VLWFPRAVVSRARACASSRRRARRVRARAVVFDGDIRAVASRHAPLTPRRPSEVVVGVVVGLTRLEGIDINMQHE